MRKQLTYLLVAGALSVGGSVLVTYAHEEASGTSASAKSAREAAIAELKIKKRDDVVAKCDTIVQNLATRVDKQKTLAASYAEKYENLVKGVSSLIVKAKADGYDTSDVEADLATLKAKVETYKTDKAAYVAALATTESYTCGNSAGAFKTALSDARTKLATVRTDIRAIHTFVEQDLKKSVKALRKASEAATRTPVPASTASTTEVTQ